MSEIIVISETTEGRDYWLQQGLGSKHKNEIRAADALIVPEKDFREGVPFVFHQDTMTLYQFIKTNLVDGISVEVCADNEEYLEISLHSSSIRLSKIVISYVAAPVIMGLLTNYIYDHMKAKPTDNVEASIVIEDNQCSAFKFDFKGEAKDFDLLADKVGELARNCAVADGMDK